MQIFSICHLKKKRTYSRVICCFRLLFFRIFFQSSRITSRARIQKARQIYISYFPGPPFRLRLFFSHLIVNKIWSSNQCSSLNRVGGPFVPKALFLLLLFKWDALKKICPSKALRLFYSRALTKFQVEDAAQISYVSPGIKRAITPTISQIPHSLNGVWKNIQ